MSQNRKQAYQAMTLFISPERLKADLALIRQRYKVGSDNPVVNRITEEEKRIGAEYVMRAKR